MNPEAAGVTVISLRDACVPHTYMQGRREGGWFLETPFN